jgi:hypothetical protein
MVWLEGSAQILFLEVLLAYNILMILCFSYKMIQELIWT